MFDSVPYEKRVPFWYSLFYGCTPLLLIRLIRQTVVRYSHRSLGSKEKKWQFLLWNMVPVSSYPTNSTLLHCGHVPNAFSAIILSEIFSKRSCGMSFYGGNSSLLIFSIGFACCVGSGFLIFLYMFFHRFLFVPDVTPVQNLTFSLQAHSSIGNHSKKRTYRVAVHSSSKFGEISYLQDQGRFISSGSGAYFASGSIEKKPIMC